MLLVLIALACATIMATAYLASRDNSAPIGENAVAASEARWASLSGIELAAAIMETEADWRTTHVEGKLLDDHVIGNAVIDIDVMDLVTELPPTAATSAVQVTISARVGDVMQRSRAEVVVYGTGSDHVDVDLAEFSVFAADDLRLEDLSVISRWSDAPMSKLGHRLALGTNASGAGAIDVKDAAEIVDATVYVNAASSATVYRSWGEQGAQIAEVPSDLPMPEPPALPTASGSGLYTFSVFSPVTLGSSNQSLNTTIVFETGVLTIEGDTTLTVHGNLSLAAGGSILVDGNAVIDVRGATMITDSAIELTEGSTLTMHLGGDFSVSGSYIGNQRDADEARDASGGASYMDVSALRIYAAPGSSDDWEMRAGSVVKANLYAPSHDLSIAGTSALYGRVAASGVELTDDSGLFYDHALDRGGGYTNPASRLWDGDALATSVGLLASLDDDALTGLAAALGVSVTSGAIVATPDGGIELYVALSDEGGGGGGSGGVTDRPIAIELTVTSVGDVATRSEVLASLIKEIEDGTNEAKTTSRIAEDLDDLETFIRDLDSDSFVPTGGRTAAQVQDIMATSIATAASLTRSGDYTMAIFKLDTTLTRFDGDSEVADVMTSGSNKSRISTSIEQASKAIMTHLADSA